MPPRSKALQRLILYHANILTMNPLMPTASAVVIERDRIRWVGEDADIGRWKTSSSVLLDCQGKTLIPGFIDAHCHIFAFAAGLLSLDLSPRDVRSIQEIKAAIRKRAESLPTGSWIRGRGYNEFYLEERRHPKRKDLDEAAPRHPVRIIHRSGHASVLNSIALRMAGISLETPEPDGGMIDRDIHTGEPTGLLLDMEDHPALKEAAHLSQEQIESALAIASKDYLSLGITSIHDATPYDSVSQWETLATLKAQGRFQPRVWKMMGASFLLSLRQAGLAFQGGDEYLKVGAVKIIVNETSGALYPSAKELRGEIMEAHGAGFPVAIHAVEASTLEAAIEALEYANRLDPHPNIRDRIEHCSVCPPSLIDRLRKLKAVVVTQPAFLYYHGERYLSEIPESDLPWLYRVGSIIKAGIMVAGSSDSPVIPNNPLVGLYAAVTRRAATGEVLGRDEALEPSKALSLITTRAAYAAGEEASKGKIAPGYLADLVLLSHDPTKAFPEALPDIKIEKTILGGMPVWDKDQQS